MDGRQEVIVGGGAGSSSGGRTAAAAVALLRVLLDCCCFTELRCCRCLGGTLKNNISCYPHSLGDATKNTTSLLRSYEAKVMQWPQARGCQDLRCYHD